MALSRTPVARYYVLLTAALASSAMATSVSCAADAPLSCHNTTAYDTCCFDYPGGDMVLTQFWDTNPATGPANLDRSWALAGSLGGDGTYDSNCDPARAYTNITQILQAGAPSTLQYMQVYWKDYQGNDESFWEHEWSKHGTCISTLSPSCYVNYQPTQEAVDFFTTAVNLFKTLPSYDWLAAAGVVPSSTTTYTLSAIQSALQSHFGHPAVVRCNSNSELNELWYHFNVQGSVQTGTFHPVDPVGSGATCPSTGVKYLPKTGGTVTTVVTSATATGTSTAPSSTATGIVLSGKGYLNVVSGGSQNGCIIGAGTWYTTGTCATFTATPSGAGFTLTSSKGKCAISNNALTCASSVTAATVFAYDGTSLAYSGSSGFYATAVPTGSSQATVYTASRAVTLNITWQAQ